MLIPPKFHGLATENLRSFLRDLHGSTVIQKTDNDHDKIVIASLFLVEAAATWFDDLLKKNAEEHNKMKLYDQIRQVGETKAKATGIDTGDSHAWTTYPFTIIEFKDWAAFVTALWAKFGAGQALIAPGEESPASMARYGFESATAVVPFSNRNSY